MPSNENSNVRIDPDLHKKAARRSLKLRFSLNQFVEKTIVKQLQESKANSYDSKAQAGTTRRYWRTWRVFR